MSNPLKKVQSGQRLHIPAAAYNAFVDAAIDHRQRLSNIGKESQPSHRSADIVLVRNDSGSPRQQFDILGIDGPIISPAANETEFRSRVALKGVTPGESHIGKFVVLAEPLANGKIGKAFIAGACPVKIDVPDEDHEWRYAEIADGVAANLKVSMQGSAGILWREGGTGVQWAIVRFGRGLAGIIFCRLDSEYTSGETAAAKLCDAAGSLQSPAVAITLQAGWTLPSGCSIATDQIMPVQAVGDEWYAIGHEAGYTVMTDMRYEQGSHKIQKKVRMSWGAFRTSESSWIDVTTAVNCMGAGE